MGFKRDLDPEETELFLAGKPAQPFFPSSLGKPSGWVRGWRGLWVGLGLGAAIALGTTRLTQTSAPQITPPAQANSQPGQSVTVAIVKLAQVNQTVDGTGSVAAVDMLPILPQMTGLQIQDVRVEEGQVVRAGDILAVLENSVLQAKLNQNRAQVESAQATVRQKKAYLNQQIAKRNQAESDLRRYQALSSQGAIGQRDLETYQTAAITAQEQVNWAETDVKSAEATVESNRAQARQTETQLAQTLVRAPAAGIIAEKFARVGDVAGSNKLFTIIRDGSLELQMQLPENQLPKVQPGNPVRITSDADARINLQGRVREIAPLVNSQTRQALVKINLPTSPFLRPGMFLRAAVTVQTTEGMTAPAKAILPQTDGRSAVFVIDGVDGVRKRNVELGSRQETGNPDTATVEIRRGLQPGDRVVVMGAGYLKDGDRVLISNKDRI